MEQYDSERGERYDSLEERRYFSQPTRYDGKTGNVYREIRGEWTLVACLKPCRINVEESKP